MAVVEELKDLSKVTSTELDTRVVGEPVWQW